MAINLVDGVDFNGLFDIVGKYAYALETLNTARLTTVPAEVTDGNDQYKLKDDATDAMDATYSAIGAGVLSWQAQGSALTSPIRSHVQNLVIQVCAVDDVQADATLVTALRYLLQEILDQDYYVDANTVSVTLAAGGGNGATDLAIAYTHKRGDGLVQENALAEVIAVSITAAGSLPTLKFISDPKADLLSEQWPKGSGVASQLTATQASASELSNGDLQDAATANIPDEWIVGVGVVGTDWVLTAPEQQTVTIASSPTAGGYWLKWVNPDGIERATPKLAFNASASAVQIALRTIAGLELVTVTSTGTTPNFVHTVVFTGVAGNINQLTALNALDVGTITPATTVAGSDNCYIGVGLLLVGDAATLATYYHALSLTPDTVYFIQWRHKKTATPAAGIVRIALVNEIAGTVLNDSAGTANSVSYDLTAGTVTTSFASAFLAVRVAPTASQPVYLEIKATTAISAGTAYCIDEIQIRQATQLYAGGIFVSAFAGKTPPSTADTWTLTVANNRASKWQEWMNRLCNMAGSELRIRTAGATLINDALIG
jgi:hypothetical protein